MFKKENPSEISSENDKTFNFNYQIDISQKKDKTDGFKEEGFDFDAFPDLKDDKTNKSQKTSNKKFLPSELIKKSEDSYMIANENISEIDQGKRKGGSVIEEFPPLQDEEGVAHFRSAYTSPKFNQAIKSQHNITTKEYQQKEEKNIQTSILNKKPKLIDQHFKKKGDYIAPEPIQFTMEDEYNEVLSMIKYYEESNSKIDYECGKIHQNIQYINNQIQNPTFDYELSKLTDETHQINLEIQEHRNIQTCLSTTHKQLQEDFQKLTMAISTMEFTRPTIIKDQSKAIIDQINALKTQFQCLKRQEGSLNLSSTLHPNPISTQNRYRSELNTMNSEEKLFQKMVEEIHLFQRESLDPKFLYNIKMACIKEEWTIYNSGQFCVHVSYRKVPTIEIKFGNKTIKDMEQFMIKQNNTVIFENEVLAARSFYLHNFMVGKDCLPFLKLELSHSGSERPLTLFIPAVSLQLGEFIPITTKQYYYEVKYHSDTLDETRTAESPIDKSIVKDVSECQFYFANLILQEDSCHGIFRFQNSSEGSLVRISQKGQLLWFQVKNNIGNLCRSLQFLFTN